MRHQPPPPSAQTPSSAGSRPHRHKQPHGGIIAPLERRIKLESTAPATRNKRGVVKVDAMFFSVYSWEVLKTRVLATLVAVSACGGFDAVSSKVQVSVGNIQKVPRLSHETGFNMGLRMYCQKSSWDMT